MNNIMKRFFLFLILGAIFISINPQETKAQTVEDDIYTKENIPAKKPMPYVHLREADVMWTKKTWQMIDCRKKMNHPLYFPLKNMDDRKSLIQLIVHGIDKEGLTVYSDDLFDNLITRDEAYAELGYKTDTQRIQQPDGSYKKEVIEGEIKYEEIKKYLIKEQWYFDKKYSQLKVRVVGICPIREYIDEDTGDKRKSQAFWIYYPEARNLFANWEVFNRHNDAQRISFDDFFQQRRFDSFIVQESNVYQNRLIRDYTTGINALLEARRIRNEIFQLEHDIWEY